MDTQDDCLRFCQDLGPSTCGWYSYFEDSQECILYESCQEVSSLNCFDCVYGQRECTPSDDTSGINMTVFFTMIYDCIGMANVTIRTVNAQTYLLVVGGEEGEDEMESSSFIYRLFGPGIGYNESPCYVNMDNLFGKPGDMIKYIQEHIVMLDGSGVPVVCGGLLGDGMENAISAGDQCYTPALNITNYDGKLVSIQVEI